MTLSRQCSRTACDQAAVVTLTYVYAEQTAVLGPLATYAEPHSYDLCERHGDRLTAPRGWDIVRLPGGADPVPAPDDLVALAEAVREHRAAREPDSAAGDGQPAGRRRAEPPGVTETGRRGHLRVLRDSSSS